MGWFDGEHKEKDKDRDNMQPSVEAPRATSAPPPRPSASTGSVIGERVQLSGTIVSDEDLTITGSVEGTIHARQKLLIAKDAKVKAVVHGRRVQLDGTLQGDVHGAEMVILGATAVMHGNIHTPSLQIRDGAFLKGSVEMASGTAEPRASKPSATGAPGATPARARPVAVGSPAQPKLPAASGAGS